jgi:hypothetical protein
MEYKADNVIYKEWEAARKLLQEFDDRIHDLRKYGFSFLTALIAAESLLIPSSTFAAFGRAGMPDIIKLAVMGVTLLLIVTLRVIERNYQLFITCAAQRARILERIMNLELTEIITDRHRGENIPRYETLIYVFFTLGVCLLGSAILFPNTMMILVLIIFILLVLYAIIRLKYLDITYKRQSMDWTIDRLECEPTDKVRITVTYIKKDDKSAPLKLGPGVVWKIKTQDNRLIHEEITKKPIYLSPEESYTWEWDTKKKEKGMYQVVIPYKELEKERVYDEKKKKFVYKKKSFVYKKKEHPLRRKIIVK